MRGIKWKMGGMERELGAKVPNDLRGLLGRFSRVMEDPKTLPPSRIDFQFQPLMTC